MLSLNKSFITIILLLISLLSINACGFKPVFKNNDGKKAIDLSYIKVPNIAYGRNGQKLRNHLRKLLKRTAQTDSTFPKTENLIVDIDIAHKPVAIALDREVSRYNSIITSDFKLIDPKTKKVTFKGQSKIIGSYETVDSDFATFSVREDTINRIIKESARDIVLRLTAHKLD